MNIKRIGIFLIISAFLFGCPGGDDPPPPPPATTPGGSPVATPPTVPITVSFDTDGGTPASIASVTINKGSSLGSRMPTGLKKSGLAFGGWYDETDTVYQKEYKNNTAINHEITLKARWCEQKETTFTFDAFSAPTETNKGTSATFEGKTAIKLSPTGSEFVWNVVSYSLSNYIGREITITLSMDVYVSEAVRIAWQINNGTDAAAAWGGAWKLVAGDAEGTTTSAATWVSFEGSATGTPAAGNNNNGNAVYLSGGGNGGQLAGKKVDIYIANFVMKIKDSTVPEKPDLITLTVGSKRDLKPLLNAEMKNKIISSWSSGDSTKVAVDNNGFVTSPITSFTNEEGGNRKYIEGAAAARVVITVKATDNTTQTFIVAATTEGWEDIATLTPFKNNFPSSFLVGNIASGTSISSILSRHFNTVTAENCMKPDALSNGRNATTGEITYTFNTANNFVAGAQAAGMKVIGHTLLWHQQIPQWQENIGTSASSPPTPEQKNAALAAMKKYITDVVTHFKGKIYSWDVLNEVFEDNGTMRTNNPWFKAIGADFVYEGFLAARLADPQAILYYNDFNTDNQTKATAIRNMVKDANDKYLALPSNQKPAGEVSGRLLIEGIGMQEHHNTSVQASNIRATLTMFKLIGVKVAVTEIDVLGQDWSSFSSVGQGTNKHAQSTVTNNGLLTQADLYAQYMAVYKDFKDIIERISIWGITDNTSWRSAGLPLLFDTDGRAKPSYYKFVGAIPSSW